MQINERNVRNVTNVRDERAYQLHLKEQIPEIVYQFDKGTFIYPFYSGRGSLQRPVTAVKTDAKRFRLSVYKSKTRIDLHLSDHYWSLPEGSLFTAYKNKGHQIKIP
jgi:hypothetical protein